MYLYQKARLRRILLVALLLGCAASFLSGMLTSLSLGTPAQAPRSVQPR